MLVPVAVPETFILDWYVVDNLVGYRFVGVVVSRAVGVMVSTTVVTDALPVDIGVTVADVVAVIGAKDVETVTPCAWQRL